MRATKKLWLLAALLASLIPAAKVWGQDERPKERDLRERREQERKSNENERLGRDGDKLGKGDERIARDADRISRDGDRLTKDGDKTGRERVDAEAKARSEKGFRNSSEFEDHYQKHVERQGEFGRISREEYLRQAKDLRDRPADGKEVKEIVRDDGRTSRYDTKDNRFGVYERDGTVVTFFKPKEGEKYFHDQAEARKK